MEKVLLMILFLILFIIWSVAHSIMASGRFKAFVRERMGQRAYDGTYRLLYNAVATVTFVPVLVAGAAAVPQRILWRVEEPFNLLFIGIQFLGFAGLVVSLLQTDLMRFVGLRQFVRYLQGQPDPNPEPRLITSGMYRIVRHPLYTTSLMLLWFAPIMTLSLLLFNIAATVYFWVGSGYEEKRLSAAFGASYDEYRKRVPRLIPVKLSS